MAGSEMSDAGGVNLGAADDADAMEGVVQAHTNANTSAPIDGTAGTAAHPAKGECNTGDKSDKDDDSPDGSSDDDSYAGFELLEWPHHRFANCVCWDKDLAFFDFDDFYAIFRDRTEMDEHQMREYHARLWEHQGVPLECEDQKTNRKPGKAGICYEECTTRELKRFVVDRSLPDRTETFHFMDLPAELRIHVCRMLFSVGYSQPRGVAILRTCRKVYDEAKGLPYSEPTPHMFFNIRDLPDGLVSKHMRVHQTFQNLSSEHGRFYCLPRAIDDYPNHLRRVQQLEIRLHYEKAPGADGAVRDADGWQPINQFLFGLASFLMEGHDLKYLHFKVDFPPQMKDSAFEECLFPLRRIRNVSNVTFEGTMPAYVTKKLSSDMSGSGLVFNTLRQWRLLNEEASAQINLLEELGCFGCDCGECPPGERAERLMIQLNTLTEARRECVFNSVREENFLARLGMLKRTLKVVNIKELQKKVRAIVEKRVAIAKYEKEVDDDCLEDAIEEWGNDVYRMEAMAKRPNQDWIEGDGIPPLDLGPARPPSVASSQFTVPDSDF